MTDPVKLSDTAQRLHIRLQHGNLTVSGFGQEPRPEAKRAFRELVKAGLAMSIKSCGIETWMLVKPSTAPA